MPRLPGWISREDRDAVILHGTALLADSREVRVRLTDISREGCRIESDECMGIGERIQLHVEALDGIAAVVRWSLEGIAGLRFEDGDWT